MTRRLVIVLKRITISRFLTVAQTVLDEQKRFLCRVWWTTNILSHPVFVVKFLKGGRRSSTWCHPRTWCQASWHAGQDCGRACASWAYYCRRYSIAWGIFMPASNHVQCLSNNINNADSGLEPETYPVPEERVFIASVALQSPYGVWSSSSRLRYSSTDGRARRWSADFGMCSTVFDVSKSLG